MPGADVPYLVARQTFIDGSKILQVQGTHAHTDKYLVGDVTINIRIDLQSEAFCLMSSAGTEWLEILHVEFMRHGSKTLPSTTRPLPSGKRRCAGSQHCPGSVEFPKEQFVS